MTTPTPGYSSPGPNTVLGVNPLEELIHATLWHAVKGHAEIVGAIVNHAEEDQLRRQIARQAHDRAHEPASDLGGTG